MHRANLLVNRISIAAVFPLALVLLLSPSLASAQSNFFAPPSYSGGGQLFVADFNGDGKPDLLSSEGTLQFGNGDGTFTLSSTDLVGTVSSGPLAVADFNGDGKPDVLEQGQGTLLVLLGNGDGTFQAPISTNSGAALVGLAAGDLNGDGNADAVGIYNNDLLVYLSKGDGTFAPSVSYGLGTTSATNEVIMLADFNGDKKTDVAVIVESEGSVVQEIVFLGNGDGTLQSPITSAGAYFPSSLITGDFNGDGKLDLAIAFDGGVSLLLGNGDGTFQTPNTVVSQGYGDLAAADLNGDGKLDLFVSGGVYLGNGDGTFSSFNTYFGANATLTVVADFNLDGKPDIAWAGYIYLGNGNGTLQGWQGINLPDLGVALVDNFDRSAAPYIAAVQIPGYGNNLYIVSNDGTGKLALAHTYTLQQGAYGIATADLNGDGNLDLVTASFDPTTNNWSYSVLLGNGDGSFQPPAFYQQSTLGGAAGQYWIIIADFNNDGKPDLAIGPLPEGLAVLLGNGDGTFGAPSFVYLGGGGSPVTADFNGDGKLDLAAVGGTTTSGEIVILLGNGDGTFQAATFQAAAFAPAGIGGGLFAVDLNGDGKPDLLAGAGQVFLGKGDGTFTALPAGPESDVYALADINGDGNLDAIGWGSNAQFNVCCGFNLGNGDGTFGPYITAINLFALDGDFGGGYIPSFLLAADMSGDGKQDLIMGVGGAFVVPNTTAALTVSLSPASLAFVTQSLGVSSPPQVSTLTNTGTASLTISAIAVTGANSGDFAQTNTCGSSLPAAGSCQISVTFTPTGGGARTAAVTITDNAPSGPKSIALTGTGTGIGLGVASGGSSSATVSAGSTATYSLSIGGAAVAGTASLTCTGAPKGAVCSLPSDSSIKFNSASPTQFNVTVTTTSRSAAALAPAMPGPTWPWAVGILVAFLLAVAGHKQRPVRRACRFVPLSFVLLLGSCGGGSQSSSTNPNGTPQGTYSLTVTATSGSLSQTVLLSLTVQ